MEFRQLGRSGLKVPMLSFGTATFGGSNEFFKAWGSTNQAEARRLVDICMDAGINFFDTADMYSDGMAESVLGAAIEGKRHDMLISTKTSFRTEAGPNGEGSSRHHLMRACEASLKRLNTDYIDVYHMHGFDALTPIEEVLSTLEALVTSGKVRYIGCSNFSGWHLMKSLAVSERHGWPRYVSHQAYYSLVGREYEWELMPLAADQGVGATVWSPLGWGRLTGKVGRNKPPPKQSRLPKTADAGPRYPTHISFASSTPSKKSAARWARASPRSPSIGSRGGPPSAASSSGLAMKNSSSKTSPPSAGSSTHRIWTSSMLPAGVTPIYPYWHQVQLRAQPFSTPVGPANT